MSAEVAVVALGARSYLRNAARQLLDVLERLAAMPIDGLPFGSWPQ